MLTATPDERDTVNSGEYCEAVRLLSAGDRDPRLRLAAVAALATLGTPEARAALVKALRHKDPGVRIGALRALSALPGAELAGPIGELLSDPEARVRVAAVRALAACPAPESVERFCALLHHAGVETRIAAAEALAACGDERALQPLAAALKECFPGETARAQLRRSRGFGILALVMLAGYALALGWGWPHLFSGLLYTTLEIGYWLHRWQRQHGRECRAITEALARVTERHPAPELEALLPELRAMAADRVTQSPETRAASRAAAERIAAVTEGVRELPIPASAPHLESASLPLPAAPPGPDR